MTEVAFIGAPAIVERQLAAARRACEQASEDLVAQQMAAAPVRTGTLRASIHIESIETAGMTVVGRNATGGESSGYAVFVHEGTSPHIIRGNPWLYWPGAEHPVQEVHHPGTRPNRYMADPLLANIGPYEAAAQAAAAGVF